MDNKREIIICDILVYLSVILVMGIHITTNFFMQQKSTETSASIENVVKVYESNPFLTIKLLTDKLTTMIFFIIKPAIVYWFYWFMRKKTIEGKVEIMTLQSYVIIIFFTTIVNFLNDFSILAGLMAKGLI